MNCPSPVYDETPGGLADLESHMSDWDYYSDDHFDGDIPDPPPVDSKVVNDKPDETNTGAKLVVSLMTDAVSEMTGQTKEMVIDNRHNETSYEHTNGRKRSIPSDLSTTSSKSKSPEKAKTTSKRKSRSLPKIVPLDENRTMVYNGGILRKIRYTDLARKNDEGMNITLGRTRAYREGTRPY